MQRHVLKQEFFLFPKEIPLSIWGIKIFTDYVEDQLWGIAVLVFTVSNKIEPLFTIYQVSLLTFFFN